MNYRMTIKLAVCALLVFALPSLYAQMPQPFSADMTTSMSGGQQKMAGKIFFSAPKMRFDMTANPESHAQGPFGGNMSMIIDGATQTSYMLMPQQQMYMEFKGSSDRMNPGARNLQNLTTGKGMCATPDTTCKKLGTEVVNGRTCDKWERTDATGKSTVWVDQKLHFPIRVQEANGSTTDFTNIKEGAQDASLFKVPAGYKPFDASAFGGRPHK
jgi:outer membrane lipoprotein-sorting protein